MRMMMGLVMAVALLVAGGARDAGASFIAYTETAIASGSLAGVSFTNAAITLSAVGDTDNVFATSSSYGIVFMNDVPVTVTVAGIGGGVFVKSFYAFASQSPGGVTFAAGFADAPLVFSTGLLRVDSGSFGAYSLQSPLGPLSGMAFYDAGVSYETPGGTFLLNSVAGTATYQATMPEPSSLTLCGVASVVGLGIARGRSRRPAGC